MITHLLSVTLAVVLYLAGVVVYRLTFHPLAKFPGPSSWAISRIPWARAMVRGRHAHEILRLHEEFGPVVRIAPDELSFITAQARQDIYGHSKKHIGLHAIYMRPSPTGSYGLFNSPDDIHARQRKMLNSAFSNKALTEQEPMIQAHVDDLMRKMRELVGAKGMVIVDINRYVSFTVFDIFGDFAFAQSFDCLKHDRFHKWLAVLMDIPRNAHMKVSADYFGFLKIFILPFLVSRTVIGAVREHWKLAVDKMEKRIASETDRKDLWSYMLSENHGRKMSVEELQMNAYSFIFAGAETTATTIDAALHFLSQHPEKVDKIRKELHTAFPSSKDITFTTVKQLPYMTAVLNESMRMASPAPSGFVRLVPSEGAEIDGLWIPGRTSVVVPYLAQNRCGYNYTYPNSFIPERWLHRDGKAASGLAQPSNTDPAAVVEDSKAGVDVFEKDKKEAFQPFNVGPRNCIGMNLAYAEMYMILACLLWEFNVSGVNMPSAGKVPIVWEHQKAWNSWERDPVWVQLTRDP